MRLVKVRAPKTDSQKVADLAFSKGIHAVTIYETNLLHKEKPATVADIVEIETNTPKAKDFVESLMDSDFYDPNYFSFVVRHPESIFASEPPEKETYPIVRPSTDVFEEFWQFSQVTVSLVLRVLLSAILVAYGMKDGYMPLIIAGLLFLPYHHHLLGMALGGSLKDGRLFGQAVKAFLIATILIVLGGVVIGLLTHGHIKFMDFAKTPILYSFIISLVIGAAAGFGAVDDAGRRELIGLAATAHLSVYPVWFGMKFVFGFDPADKPMEFLLVFLMDVVTITLAALVVFSFMKMKGRGIRRFGKELRQSRK